eukprot:10792087-Alexandrium_andersonii.AAC.1
MARVAPCRRVRDAHPRAKRHALVGRPRPGSRRAGAGSCGPLTAADRPDPGGAFMPIAPGREYGCLSSSVP